MFLSVVVPAYNEQERIKKTLIEVGGYLDSQLYDYEIIVVNDGSTDGTVGAVESLNLKNTKIINNKKNHGKGYVVRQGLLAATGEYHLFMDADNSTSIEELSNFLPYARAGFDIVIGSRSIKGAKIILPQPFQRKIFGAIYRILVKCIAGLSGFYDTQCGFKIFNSKSAQDIFPQCRINGWSFDVEILVLAKKLGYKVKEVPIIWSDSSGTKVNMGGNVKAVFELLKIRWNTIKVTFVPRKIN